MRVSNMSETACEGGGREILFMVLKAGKDVAKEAVVELLVMSANVSMYWPSPCTCSVEDVHEVCRSPCDILVLGYNSQSEDRNMLTLL